MGSGVVAYARQNQRIHYPELDIPTNMLMKINDVTFEGTQEELSRLFLTIKRKPFAYGVETYKADTSPILVKTKKKQRPHRKVDYTEDEINFIKNNPDMKPRELAKVIKVHSIGSIYQKRLELNGKVKK